MVKQKQEEFHKKTLVLGASANPNRYSNIAIHSLLKKKYKVVGVGVKAEKVEGVNIYDFKKEFSNIHTVTLYLNPKNQQDYYSYILYIKPKRVIFNPGTANFEFQKILKQNNIEVLEACTLVLLSTNQY